MSNVLLIIVNGGFGEMTQADLKKTLSDSEKIIRKQQDTMERIRLIIEDKKKRLNKHNYNIPQIYYDIEEQISICEAFHKKMTVHINNNTRIDSFE